MADDNAASKKSKTGSKLQSIVLCVTILITIVLVCVSVVLDPVHAASGFAARTHIVSHYALPTISGTSFLDELDKDIEDYTVEELADIFSSDEDKRRSALRCKYASEVRVNEYGQTYGSGLAGDPSTGEGVPELISVMASNGKDGYMYFSDVQKIYQRDFTVTPEELEVTAPQKEEAIAKALNELIADKYGCELISTEELLEINKNRSSMGGAAAVYQQAQAKVVARIEANKDVNGKAIVEATKRSNVDLKDEAISKLASNANIDAAGSAQKLLDQATYDILYQQARDTTGVPIPVYLSDGRTLIGEYRMDSL